MKQTVWIAGLLMALLLEACGTPAEPVQPITDIIASEPEFVDISSNSATLLVNTEIDMACAVVYGPTTDFGFIATDSDMAGGAHSDHHPLLAGLEPDTLYYARLQGSAADGTLYRSEVYSFRTLPADSTDRGPNLALLDQGAQVTEVSSNFGGAPNGSRFGADNAIDGDPTTEWSSDGDGDQAWIEIELAQDTRVAVLGFWTRTMGDSAEIHSFQLVTDSGEVIGPFELSGAGGPDYFEVDFAARRVRFEVVSSSGGNTGAVELELYGEPEG